MMTRKSYQQKITEVVDSHPMEALDVGVVDTACVQDILHMDDEDDNYGVAVAHMNILPQVLLLLLVLNVREGEDTNDEDEEDDSADRIHSADEHEVHMEDVILGVVVDTGSPDVDTLDTLCYRNDADPFDLRIALHWIYEVLTSSVDPLYRPVKLWSVLMIPHRENPLVSMKSTTGTV
jgi:hypothetical protein